MSAVLPSQLSRRFIKGVNRRPVSAETCWLSLWFCQQGFGLNIKLLVWQNKHNHSRSCCVGKHIWQEMIKSALRLIHAILIVLPPCWTRLRAVFTYSFLSYCDWQIQETQNPKKVNKQTIDWTAQNKGRAGVNTYIYDFMIWGLFLVFLPFEDAPWCSCLDRFHLREKNNFYFWRRGRGNDTFLSDSCADYRLRWCTWQELINTWCEEGFTQTCNPANICRLQSVPDSRIQS